MVAANTGETGDKKTRADYPDVQALSEDQTEKQGPLSSLAKESTWLDILQELAHRPWLDFCLGEGQEYEHEGTPNMVPTPKHLNLHKHSRFLSQE